jgi:sodium transport system permease protein
VAAALLYAVFGPLAAGMALAALAEADARSRRPLELAMAGRDRAPSLVRYLEERGVRLREVPADPLSAIRGGEVDAAVVIDGDYAADFRRSSPARVRLIFDSSRDESREAEERARALLASYGRAAADLRLQARGVSPALSRPLDVRPVDLGTPTSRAGRALLMLPIYLLLAAFIGGMSVAIDVTAGERERGSLESLLVAPAPRLSLATGKWLAAVALNVVVVAATVAVSFKVVNAGRFQELAVPIGFDASQALSILAYLTPLALLGPAVQMLLAFFAKTYKEAQTYLSLLLFAPMVPGMLLAFGSLEPAPWMERVPVLGQQVLMNELLEGKAPEAARYGVLGAVTVLAALACVYTTGRLLQHERAVLGC